MFWSVIVCIQIMVHAVCNQYTTRKEIRNMSTKDWTIFTDTIQKAQLVNDSTIPSLSIWEYAAYAHNQYSYEIHWHNIFFYWHRYHLIYMEKELQKINSAFFFPWFNETNPDGLEDLLARTDFLSTVSRDISPSTMLPNITSTLPSINVFAYYQSKVNNHILPDTYWTSNVELQHGLFHNMVGGIMSTMLSPLDPLFYIHHGFYDLMWHQAQELNHWNNTENGTQILPLYKNITAQQMVLLDSWCIHYDTTITSSNQFPKSNGTKTQSQTSSISCPTLNPEWLVNNRIPLSAVSGMETDCISAHIAQSTTKILTTSKVTLAQTTQTTTTTRFTKPTKTLHTTFHVQNGPTTATEQVVFPLDSIIKSGEYSYPTTQTTTTTRFTKPTKTLHTTLHVQNVPTTTTEKVASPLDSIIESGEYNHPLPWLFLVVCWIL